MSKHRSLGPFTASASLLPIILTIINITGIIDVCRSETVGQETPDGHKTEETIMGGKPMSGKPATGKAEQA